MNNVVLIGRLVRDPELKFIPSNGRAVANFTLAVDKELPKDIKADYESKGKPTADFIRIVVFGKQAENCANYLKKGIMTSVIGRISTGSYTTQSGEKRYTTEVVANRVEFLEWGGGSSGTNNKSSQNNSDDDFANFEEDDIFEPTDDDDIPF
jgi:single-strand DNA-binding protein